MLQIKEIAKEYRTGDLVQTALNSVSLNLRDSEFVAVLGPSGSGKTTLLNIIGGLDRYDSGDLVINGVSTKEYKDRDWDSYRNHTIGFVFQSYNLIPHQSILSNVELALTISGISRQERKQRAINALTEVGLGDQIHKKPNQMSGGQMQRVAIARALVNNPDILLADEPTGALDTETSVQVMELLKEVAKDRLVVMVTHNPELAEEYATRIVKLRDGNIIDDTMPFDVPEEEKEPEHKNLGKASMSFATSLALSFNNLKTKKGRTFLTAFAGSIGIIGIALILSLSTGVNDYITDIQKSTMTSYPISIQSKTIDLSSMMENHAEDQQNNDSKKTTVKTDGVYSNGRELEEQASMTTSVTENNLTKFKKYLDNKDNDIWKYIGENGVVYGYDTKFDVYAYDKDDTLINTDGSTFEDENSVADTMISSRNSMMSLTGNEVSNFAQLMPESEKDGSVSHVLKENYDIVYGDWADKYNEVVLVLNKNNQISTKKLYELGLLPASEYKKLLKKINAGDEVTIKDTKLDYKDVCNQTLYMIPTCDYYQKDDNGNYPSVKEDDASVKDLVKDAIELKITGVIKQHDEDSNVSVGAPIGYTKALTDYLIKYAKDSKVVKAQEDNKNESVINGMEFEPADDTARIADAKKYLQELNVSDKAAMCRQLMQATGGAAQIQGMSEEALASALDGYLANPDDDALLDIYENYISPGSYEDNLDAFGVVSLDAPTSIDIYSDSFEAKDSIAECITEYNKTVSKENKITYTDYVAMLMSSITTIINVISYVLIAFVAVSLIVSSIMIGIITYISVLERTKEIGILRAMGASKSNISQVFNAETFIIGLLSGVLGIVVSLIFLIPINAIIHAVAGTTDVSASLPVLSAIILIIISVILTLIGGWIPSKKAAKKDPVIALRTE